jgi:hypothetical protein
MTIQEGEKWKNLALQLRHELDTRILAAPKWHVVTIVVGFILGYLAK